jgi:ABC-type sugar transport system ATPase subunit
MSFLLDEPLSNIDALMRVMMRADLKRLQQRLGVTTVFVTHDQVEAMTLSDRIVVMDAGEVRQVGSPLFASPDMRVVLPPGAAHVGGEVMPGVRPEEIKLSATELPGAPVGDVLMVETLGHETIVHSAVGKNVVRVRVSGDAVWRTGQRVWLRVGQSFLLESHSQRLVSWWGAFKHALAIRAAARQRQVPPARRAAPR